MKNCFGDIFPDLERFQFGQRVAGKVFQVRVDTIGPGQRDRKLDINLEAWQECQRCEDFQEIFNAHQEPVAVGTGGNAACMGRAQG